jgi:hypothetical protein
MYGIHMDCSMESIWTGPLFVAVNSQLGIRKPEILVIKKDNQKAWR